ncbi:MAG: fumarylacetoacetate hydrolase family protein [Chloroflexota bacterium]
MLTEQQHQAAAQALFQAEIEDTPTEPISLIYPDADISDAYRISQLVTELKVANGRAVKGQKIGFTSKAMQEMVGTTEPDYGNIFDNWFVDEGSIIPYTRLNRPKVEIEIAFVLHQDLTGPYVNPVDVIRATDFILPAFEIVDNRYSKRGNNGLVDSIADAAGCGLVILGGNPVRLTDIDIRRLGGSLSKNGEVEVSGTTSAVMGNPVNAIAWLARKLHEFDVTLEAGQTILSGSFTRAIEVNAGDTFTADFLELGVMSFGVA